MAEVSNEPLSEQYRVVAKAWVDADSAADLWEEMKSVTLSQHMAELTRETPGIPVSKAEMSVKASLEWSNYIKSMTEARKAANLLKVKLEYLRMRHAEQQSFEASRRAEMRL